MFNKTEVYAECGRRAGTARKQGDESHAKCETDYFHRMLALESAEHKRLARVAFDTAYRNARGMQLWGIVT